jgi:phosphoribosyl 1,2-cyclic phosphodiesterase
MTLHPEITALIEEAERTKQRAIDHGSTDLADQAQRFIDDLREKGTALADVDHDAEANQVVEEAKVQLAHLADEGH